MSNRNESEGMQDRLLDGLESTPVSGTDAKKILSDVGFDTEQELTSFKARLSRSIRAHTRKAQTAIRDRAKIEIAEAQQRDEGIVDRIDSYSRDELLAVFTSAQSGQLGHSGQEIALAARNSTGEEPEEEELRALVHDILSAQDQEP